MASIPTQEDLLKRIRELEAELDSLKKTPPLPDEELRKFQTLYDLAVAMTGDKTLDENLELVVKKTSELFYADGSYIFLRDEQRSEVYMHSYAGIETSGMQNLRLPFGKGIGGEVALTRKGMIVEEYSSDKRIDRTPEKFAAEEGIVALLAVPLQMGLKNLGVLFVFNRERTEFTQANLETVALIGNLAAVEIARKQTVEALHKTGTTIQALFDYSPLAIVSLDRDTKVTMWNPAAERIFGWKWQEVVGKPYPAVPDSEYEAFKDIFSEEIGGKGLKGIEVLRRRKDGTLVDISAHTAPLRDVHGEITGIMTLMEDITERKQADDNLRESEERYRSLVEMSPEAVFVHIDGKFVYINQQGAQILGANSPEELIGLPVIDFIHPDYHHIVKERIGQIHREKQQLSRIEEKYLRMDGKIIDVEATGTYISYGGQPAGLSVIRDITHKKESQQEREKLEAQLEQARKMEALGTLAGGIAHDFNNLLMGIQGNASLMLLDADRNHPNYEKLKHIEEFVVSGTELTRQLLGLAKGGKYELKPTDLNQLVKKNAEMFGRTKKEILIHFQFDEALWPVEVDQGQIEQVLVNLFVNAGQAMPTGGELRLATRNKVISEQDPMHPSAKPGRFVCLSVADTGIGMDANTRLKIFDPFFTTKEISRGTGLGLSSAYGIISNHGGYIDVESREGEGSKFTIYLPASEKSIPQDDSIEESIESGTDTILLVDDEEIVINVARQMLARLGHTVLVAKNGEEAVETFRKNYQTIDLVILDMIMPVMGGSQTYDILKEINPAVKVLLSSGYSMDGQAIEILRRGCDGFIQKPFSIAKLSKKIRDVLDA